MCTVHTQFLLFLFNIKDRYLKFGRKTVTRSHKAALVDPV